MSLRLRLLLGLVGLVALGLTAIDTITYLSLQSSLSQQIDTQLTSSVSSVYRCLQDQVANRQCFDVLVPSGTYAELVPASGSPTSVQFVPRQGVALPKPDLPAGFGTAATSSFHFITVPAQTGEGEFRAMEVLVTPAVSLVVAMPLTNVDATLSQLRLLEVVVSVGVLILLGALAWWTVQFGLRPFRRIRDTAQRIAAGDLASRIEGADPRTEVGQLAVSLNEMLAQIERAFSERSASEARLRRFVADASHELRTPLSSIRGYAELFRRGAKSNPEDLDKAMSRIESEAMRMGQLVDDMLLLARLDEGRPLDLKAVDLSELAVDTAADQSAADRRHPISVWTPGPVLVSGDEPRLRQVVANLVRNAVVHTPAGTAIEIRTSVSPDAARLEVIDHGPGVPAEQAERIFERFYRVDRARERARGGAGLGLSIVASIVAAHGGRVEFHPTPGGGATFAFELPAGSRPGRLEPEGQPAPLAVSDSSAIN